MNQPSIASPRSFLFSRRYIVAEVVRWAILQRRDGIPPKLNDACSALLKLLPDGKDNMGFFTESRSGLWSILDIAIAQVPEILAWNIPASGKQAQVVFTSRYPSLRPEDDFIDLDALIQNVVRELVAESTRHSDLPQLA